MRKHDRAKYRLNKLLTRNDKLKLVSLNTNYPAQHKETENAAISNLKMLAWFLKGSFFQ